MLFSFNNRLRGIERLQAADRSYMEEGVKLLDLAQNAQRLFCEAGTARKTPAVEFLAIELRLARWRGRSQFPSTV
jgi:hypothetical protein